ncbi:MAG: hypothetical protein ACUVS2_08415 [Candidatus Flexifilum sp.]|jgi:hypothetical protein
MRLVRQLAPLLIFILFVFGYVQPWVINGSAALNLNGYDLAEWTSLHPAAQGQTPPLLTALLLRLPLVCAVLWFVWHRPYAGQMRLAAAAILIVTAISLLPPIEFVSQRDNPNYQQQAGLAALTLALGLAGLSITAQRGSRIRMIGGIGALVIGIGAGWGGLLQAAEWMRAFRLPALIGGGALLMLLASGAAAGAGLLSLLYPRSSSGQSL